MKRLILFAALVVMLAACGGRTNVTLIGLYDAKDYQWHKNTIYIKLHWNLKRPDKDTIIAEGFVEPFNPKLGLHNVDLELVGLGENDEVVNTATGRPKDNYIASPLGKSPFRITMKLNGREKDFTIKGGYYHYVAGVPPDFSSANYDYIQLHSDEPY
jgi:hypothetical protein